VIFGRLNCFVFQTSTSVLGITAAVQNTRRVRIHPVVTTVPVIPDTKLTAHDVLVSYSLCLMSWLHVK